MIYQRELDSVLRSFVLWRLRRGYKECRSGGRERGGKGNVAGVVGDVAGEQRGG
jgi:hypothetical protein